VDEIYTTPKQMLTYF